MGIQKIHNINVSLYTPLAEGQVELFKPFDEFVKERKDVRILFRENGLTEHRALIKTIETLIERPDKKNHKNYYCDRCTYISV